MLLVVADDDGGLLTGNGDVTHHMTMIMIMTADSTFAITFIFVVLMIMIPFQLGGQERGQSSSLCEWRRRRLARRKTRSAESGLGQEVGCVYAI